METEIIRYVRKDGKVHDFKVRTHLRGDEEAVQEVFMDDCYGLKNLSQNPEKILNIGGHIGSFDVLAAKLYPECEIHTYEPHKESFELLQFNIRNLLNIHAHNLAIRNEPGEYLMTSHSESTLGCKVVHPGQECVNFPALYEVPVRSLRSVYEECLFFDFIKMDCENSEHDILPCLSNLEKEWDHPLFGKISGEWHAMEYTLFTQNLTQLFPHRLITINPQETNSTMGFFSIS
jgi:FkbM family methyltransferase